MSKVNPIERLIRPKSIAVFGGSWAHSVLEQCQKMGYRGELWPVHPSHKTVAGLRCYASVDDLPSAPDASFLGVNREITIELVRQLSALGAGGAVCFAAGFSEAAEEDANAATLALELLDAAGDMPFLGPNCYGYINCLDRALLWPDQHGAQALASGVAIVTQSSNIAINLTMQTRGLPIAYVFTAGNQASVTLAQLAMTALEDERVSCVGLHIEGFGNIRDFEQLANRAKQLGKPIVALKVGKSDASQLALKSHTSSLTGSDASAHAFLNRLEIPRAHSIAVFLETLKLFHTGGVLANNQVLSMSCSGGEACLMGDAVHEQGLICPPLNDIQRKALRVVLGPRVALANPLDYNTYIWNDYNAMLSMFSGMLNSDAAIAVLVLDFPRIDRCEYDSWLVAIDAFKAAGANWSGQLAVLASLPENMPESIAVELIEAGVVPFCGLDDAIASIAAATAFAPVLSASSNNDHESRQIVPVLMANEHREHSSVELVAIEEAIAKQWLGSVQVSTPKGVVLNGAELGLELKPGSGESKPHPNADYVNAQCASLTMPVVLKCMGSLHKSDTGGIALGIGDQDELCKAMVTMNSNGDYYIEEQIQNSVCELLVGIVRDPVHGFLFTVGAGGTHTELWSDTASALLPLSRDELYYLLSQLRCFALLQGYRGAQACNMESLLNTLLAIQAAAITIADELYELEINPLLCTPDDAVVVDALLRVSGQSSIINNFE